MTPEQVSALSDTELNRAMIWLYAKNRFIDREYKVADVIGNLRWYRAADYLADWNLTMPLAVENCIWLQPDCIGDGKLHAYDDTHSTSNKNPLRAICEVLVLIKYQ